jgi:hypothetical protein
VLAVHGCVQMMTTLCRHVAEVRLRAPSRAHPPLQDDSRDDTGLLLGLLAAFAGPALIILVIAYANGYLDRMYLDSLTLRWESGRGPAASQWAFAQLGPRPHPAPIAQGAAENAKQGRQGPGCMCACAPPVLATAPRCATT